MSVFLEWLWEWVAGGLFRRLLWLVLFPVVWVVSLPIILITACFRRGPYTALVRSMLLAVNAFWSSLADYFLWDY